MTSPLNLTCSLSSNTLKANAEPHLLYLLLEISGGGETGTIPSNLSFIIDTSDSMHIRIATNEQFAELVKNGQVHEVMTDGVPAFQVQAESLEWLENIPRRIDYVSNALEVISDHLRPTDWFSLVAFASHAYCLIPSSSGRERQRLHAAVRELENLRLGDKTQLAEGLAMAYSQIAKRSGRSYADRMILLTDGHTRNVKDCYELARKARHENVKLTTMGIGAEFNEELLIPLADLTGGNAFFIESPDQIPKAFHQELGSALHISYRDVEIKLNIPNEVTIRDVFRVLPELSEFDQGPHEDGNYSLFVGDYDSAETISLLVEILVPVLPLGNYRLAQVLLSWDDPTAELVRQNQRQDIHINLVDKPMTHQNDRVMNIAEKVGMYKMGTQALLAAQKAAGSEDMDEKELATLRLRQAATRLLDMGAMDLADSMFQQSNNLEHEGSIDSEATKKLRYETRRITKLI